LSLAMRFMAAPEDSQICKARLRSTCWPRSWKRVH
jgi:hypothetical protein